MCRGDSDTHLWYLWRDGAKPAYDGVNVLIIVPGAITLPAIRVVSGVEFTVLDTQDTVSQISFVASVMMSGTTLECVGNGPTGTVTFHVDPVVGECRSMYDGGGGLAVILNLDTISRNIMPCCIYRDENSSRPSVKIRSNTFSGRLFLPVTVT